MTKDCPTCGRPMGDIEAPGMVGTHYPDTSKNAAVRPRFGGQRHRVMEILYEEDEATAASIADRMGVSRNQIATRLLELRRGGYATFVRDEDGEVIKESTGGHSDGRVQTLTPSGRVMLRFLRKEGG